MEVPGALLQLAGADSGAAMVTGGSSNGMSVGATAPERGPVEEECLGRLRVIEHGVHKLGIGPDGSEEHVVSTLRPFTFSVGLYGTNGNGIEMLIENHEVVQLTANLLFENGQSVAMLPGSPAMTGEIAMLAQGRAIFKIRLNVLSSQRDGQRFRIRVMPSEGSRPIQGVVSEPVRTITKLHRGPRLPLPEEGGTAERPRVAKRHADEWDDSLPVSGDDLLSAPAERPTLAELQRALEAHGQAIAKMVQRQQRLQELLASAQAEQQAQAPKQARIEAHPPAVEEPMAPELRRSVEL